MGFVAMAECRSRRLGQRTPVRFQWPTARKYPRASRNNERTVIAATRLMIFTVQILLCHGDRSDINGFSLA